MTNSIKTLLNGVKMYALEVENDFVEAQDIFDISEQTERFDVESIFNERVENDFCGTYKVKIQRTGDYSRFIDLLYTEKRNAENTAYSDIRTKRNEGVITWDEFWVKEEEVLKEIRESKLYSFRFPTLEEWINGKYQESEKRELRLSKALSKNGFPQTVIDFYSAQVKTEKDTFITISDRVQHIAGMSNYCDLSSNETRWDGYNGSSCQDTRHGYSEIYRLSGAIYDNKLFIAMMHDEIDDLEDMTDKLRARVLLRLVTLEDGKQVLLSTLYYGNNKTKSELDNGMKQLHEVGIFEQIEDGYDNIREKANGYYYDSVSDEVNVCETIDEEVTCECPMCEGSGEYEVYSERVGTVEIKCPACNGDGHLYTSVYLEIDEYIEVGGDDEEIEPYAEMYSHNGSYITMNTDMGYITGELERIRLEYEGLEIDSRLEEWTAETEQQA